MLRFTVVSAVCVCGHVIFAFVGMPKDRIPIGSQSGKDSLKVSANLGVSILLDQQRCRCVLDVNRREPGVDAGLLDKGTDFRGDFVEAAPAG